MCSIKNGQTLGKTSTQGDAPRRFHWKFECEIVASHDNPVYCSMINMRKPLEKHVPRAMRQGNFIGNLNAKIIVFDDSKYDLRRKCVLHVSYIFLNCYVCFPTFLHIPFIFSNLCTFIYFLIFSFASLRFRGCSSWAARDGSGAAPQAGPEGCSGNGPS